MPELPETNNKSQREGHCARLERAFQDLAQQAPSDCLRWSELASSGADAARSRDAAEVL